MVWYCGFESLTEQAAPLSKRTTFRIGGPAETLCEPPDEPAFAAAYGAARRAGQPVHVLGGGSNVLVPDEGVRGAVLSTRRLAAAPQRQGAQVRALAGVSLGRLITWAAQQGLAGLEALAGIPGTVGGAVRMNAGGRHGCIGEFVRRVWVATDEGGIRERAAADIRWEYRRTDIVRPILAVEFELCSDRPEVIVERRCAVFDEKRASQPNDASAGCFFKNPPGDSAGRLIDRAGLKGTRVGAACVSTVHANFIVNLGGATAADVQLLAGAVRDAVRADSAVALETEVRCWPESARKGE